MIWIGLINTPIWSYRNTNHPQEISSLSYQIDLMKVLSDWVTIGFSASTGTAAERHTSFMGVHFKPE